LYHYNKQSYLHRPVLGSIPAVLSHQIHQLDVSYDVDNFVVSQLYSPFPLWPVQHVIGYLNYCRELSRPRPGLVQEQYKIVIKQGFIFNFSWLNLNIHNCRILQVFLLTKSLHSFYSFRYYSINETEIIHILSALKFILISIKHNNIDKN
jgi:hypothetical protein